MPIGRLRTAMMVAVMMVSSPVPAMDSAALQIALSKDLPANAVAALAQIPEPGPKLLAARSYLRSRENLQSRWSWDDAQVAAYQGSPEQAALLREVDQISRHFAEANPGFSLYVNSKVRSLDQQISSWNNNASVNAAGAALLSALVTDPAIDVSEENPRLADQLQRWLRGFTPNPGPNLAAPGLSAHGQMRAIDFQIQEKGVVIAPADSRKIETVWRQGGWDRKLKVSIVSAGPAFRGPLTSPDEPWHYTYTPGVDEVAAATTGATRCPWYFGEAKACSKP